MKLFRFGLSLFALVVAVSAQTSASEWNDHGLAATARRDHAEAERSYRKAIELWESMGSDYEAHLGSTQLNLSQALSAQGRRTEGAAMLEAALAKFRRTVGLRSERALIAMNLLGATYLMLGEGAKAEALFREALPIERDLPHDIQMARTLGGLATINLNAGKLDEALVQAEEALKIAIAADGENSVDTALAYATAGEVHRIAGRRDRALPLFRKSRFIYEKALGPEHPRAASLLSQEGLVLMGDGKYSLAERSMARSLEIIRKVCPGCVYEEWMGLCNLGLLRLKQKRYAEADGLLSQSLEIQEKHSARPGPEMVSTIEALATVRGKLRRFEDADRLNKRADLLRTYR